MSKEDTRPRDLWGGLWSIFFVCTSFWSLSIDRLAVPGTLGSALIGGLQCSVMMGSLSVLATFLYASGSPKGHRFQHEWARREQEQVYSSLEPIRV